MLISNVKSNADLVGKKKLQSDLLELAVANEAEQERRVKDYKNPNKPVPVAPEYKSNAELQKDRLLQERKAIENMEEFDFDYTKSAELVSWLSSSLVNRLVEFNANFRGIKKELLEKTNPKLLTTDYLKNYLENYFEDMDVNFGRKFGKRETDGTTMPTTVDDLTMLMPDAPIIDELVDTITAKYEEIRDSIPPYKQRINDTQNDIARFKAEETVAVGEVKKSIKAVVSNAEKGLTADKKTVEERVAVLRDFDILREVLNLYAVVLPSNQLLTTMKQSLTQQERAELVKRYVSLLRKIKILTRNEIEELIQELRMASNISAYDNFIRKINKGLSFLTDKTIDDINKLQRDYEYVITHSSRTADAGNIKQLTDMREEAITQAIQTLTGRKINQTVFVDDEEGGPRNVENIVRMPNAGNRAEMAGDLSGFMFKPNDTLQKAIARSEIDNEITAINEREFMDRQATAKRLSAYGGITYQDAQQLQLGEEEEQKAFNIGRKRYYEGRRLLYAPPLREAPPPLETTPSGKMTKDQTAFVEGIRQYYNRTFNELDDIYTANPAQGIKTVRNYLENGFGFTKEKVKKNKGASDDETYGMLRDKLGEVMDKKTMNILAREGMKIADYDYIDKSVKARIGNTQQRTQYGVGVKKKGLPAKVIKHLQEDDEENKALSKAFKKHMKIEEEVNGGALKFKHKKIKVGKGISIEAQPAYKTFGKYIIHMGHLLDKNVANFKYPSMGSIPAIKPLTITDDYKDFILDTLENGKPNERFFSKLPDEEQKHFERVISGAGLLEVFKLRRNKSDTEKKESERFNILRGEVMAGNNADKVIKELRGLILRFMNDGRIQQKEGTAMLLELSAI